MMRSLAVCAALAAATSTEGLPAAAPLLTGAPAKSAVDTAPEKLRTPPSQHPDPAPTAPQSPPVETQPLTDDEVCVVITGYDTADTVADAVASVLAQTHEHLHIVFVDDGSRDATKCAVELALAGDARDHAVVALQANTPGGVGTAANRGMDACPATADYVAFLDADDVMARTALELLVAAAREHGADVVLGDWFKFDQATGKQLPPYDAAVMHTLPTDAAFTVKEHPQVLRASPVPWRKLYGADHLRRNGVRFPEGDHFFEDNAFHWRALLSDPRLAYVATPVVAHTVGDARQTTAGIDGDDSEKLAGHFPNLEVIARELIEERAPAHLLRDFANFLSRSKWVVTRQRDAHLRAKFARVLQRTARAFVAAASTFSDADLTSELEDNAYVRFGADAAPRIELSVVVPTKDVGATQITDLLAALTRVPLATEIIVVDDGSTDGTVAAVENFREHHANVYLLRDAVSRGAGRARNRAAPLLEGAFTVYVDADDAVDPQALAAAVRGLPDGADLLFFPYAIDERSKTRAMWAAD